MTDTHTPLVDLDAWLDDWSTRDDADELVGGTITVAPSERYGNLRAGYRLTRLLEARTRGEVAPVGHLDVVLTREPATVRRPDLVVPRGRPDPAEGHLAAADVAFVAEVVSPGSVDLDWVTKRAEYAAAGIPAYLVVDLRDHVHTLAVFEAPGPAGYTRVHEGEAVTLRVGDHVVDVTVDDLLD